MLPTVYLRSLETSTLTERTLGSAIDRYKIRTCSASFRTLISGHKIGLCLHRAPSMSNQMTFSTGPIVGVHKLNRIGGFGANIRKYSSSRIPWSARSLQRWMLPREPCAGYSALKEVQKRYIAYARMSAMIIVCQPASSFILLQHSHVGAMPRTNAFQPPSLYIARKVSPM